MKKDRFTFLYALLLMAVILLSACTPAVQSNNPKDESLSITVSILPQAYFVERIGGENVKINVMVGPGEEAHTYEPKPEQMKMMAESALFFSIGVEYEETWLPRFLEINPQLMVVDSATGIDRIQTSDGHSHDDDDDHEEDSHTEDDERTDPHVWLSPGNGKLIAENIFNALVQMMPEEAENLQENYTSLVNDIDRLDADINETLSQFENRTFMVFHPAWGYFAEQYNLEQISVQVGGQDPSPAEMADLIKIAREEDVRVIFIQPTFSTASVEALSQELGAEIVLVDPLARDWLENLKQAAGAFAGALR
jgi:zinc transport system substrate-binding protein